MNRMGLLGLTVGVALATAGCNTMAGQPEMVRAGITPNELRPGDEALIQVELKDKHQVVQAIEGVVQEDQRITFDLNDKGEQADAAAGDGVWTFGVKVPFQAPDGEFLLDLTAYRSDGNPVSIRDKDGNVVALQETVPLVIRVNAPASESVIPEEGADVDMVEDQEEESETGRSPKSIMGGKKQAEEEEAEVMVDAPVEEVAPEESDPVEEAPVEAEPVPGDEAVVEVEEAAPAE